MIYKNVRELLVNQFLLSLRILSTTNQPNMYCQPDKMSIGNGFITTGRRKNRVPSIYSKHPVGYKTRYVYFEWHRGTGLRWLELGCRMPSRYSKGIRIFKQAIRSRNQQIWEIFTLTRLTSHGHTWNTPFKAGRLTLRAILVCLKVSKKRSASI